jgi:predicted RNase H-like nuclease
MSFVGVDSCKAGWVAVVLRDPQIGEKVAPAVEAHYLAEIDAVGAAVPDADVIAIDIPIGLPAHGRRAADQSARDVLGVQRNTVFFTPVRAAVEAATHVEASAAALAATGQGISQQAFALAPKILQVERWLPSAASVVIEAHPELAFRQLIGGPIARKKSWAGVVRRRRALVEAGIDVDGIDDAVARVAAPDDVLDAAVIAWTARRYATGEARRFPSSQERGEPVIWA